MDQLEIRCADQNRRRGGLFSLPFVYSLQASSRHLVPMGQVLFAFLEEIRNFVARLLSVVGVDVETRDPINDDLSWTSLVCGEGRQPAVHCLDDCKSKCFVQCRLNCFIAEVRIMQQTTNEVNDDDNDF